MVKDGENIFDYCVSQTGDVNNFINMITLNNINVNDDIQSGETILIPDELNIKESYEMFVNDDLSLIKQVQDNQNVFDISTQYFGDIKYLFTLLNDNNINVNSNLKSGLELLINNANFGNENIKDMFLKLNIFPSNNQDQSRKSVVKGDYNNDYGLDHY